MGPQIQPQEQPTASFEGLSKKGSSKLVNTTNSFFKHPQQGRSLHTSKWIACFLAGLGLSVSLGACNGTNPGNSSETPGPAANQPVEINLVSYAVTRAAYEQIIPKFAAKWQQEHNQAVKFNQSYGGSGSQTRAVIDGLEADVVALALASDVQQIEKAELIAPGWEKETPNNGIVHKSVAAIVTREGNPKNIRNWQDLTRDDVSVITANPKTSGGARWNFLVLWGAITETGGSETQAQEFTRRVYQNVPILPRDAREASDVFFKQGQGDALINYENEMILAGQQGISFPYTIPDVNISIDNPVAVVDKNVDRRKTREVAEAFVQYLFTPEAQREFAKVGFRPINTDVAQEFAKQYPPVKNLFTVEDLGGWSTINQKFFADGTLFDQLQANLGK